MSFRSDTDADPSRRRPDPAGRKTPDGEDIITVRVRENQRYSGYPAGTELQVRAHELEICPHVLELVE